MSIDHVYDSKLSTGNDRKLINGAPPSISTTSSVDVGKILVRTKMCSLFLSGKCHYGADRCFYAHSPAELREKPQLAKTSLCPSFKRGCCRRGGNCTYAHDVSEMTASSKSVRCLWYANGHCSHGSSCRFLHSESAGVSPSSISPTTASFDEEQPGICHECGGPETEVLGCLCRVFRECSEILEGLL